MNLNEKQYKSQIVYTMNRVYKNGLTTTSGGNISMIDDEDNIYITPGGIDKGTLREADIMFMKANGEAVGIHNPSVEYPFHRHIYKVRKDLKSILHAHPPGLVAISAARKNPRTQLIDSIKKLIPQTSFAPYALPGSKQLGENIAEEFSKGYNVIFLENHGVVIGAQDLSQAYIIFEALENFVNTEIKALSLHNTFIMNEAMNIKKVQEGDLTTEHLPMDSAKKIIDLIKRSYSQGLFTAHFGCISVRVNDNDFIMTPAHIDRLLISEEDLIYVKDGKVSKGKIADETCMLHYDVYQLHPEINTIFVATPQNVMSFAITNKAFDSRIIPEGYIMLKQVKKLSANNYNDIINTISKECPVIIIENNYVLVAGANLLQAFDRLEVLEYGANSLIMANQYSKVFNISDEEIQLIDNNFNVW